MEALGINPVLLITQIINFSILLFLLSKFLYKPIIKSLDDRKRKIQEGLNYTEKMKNEYDKLEEIKKKRLYQTDKEAAAVIKKAEERTKTEYNKIIIAAKEEARKIVIEEKKEWDKKQKQIEKRLQQETAELAIMVASSVIKDLIDEKEQSKLIKQAMQNIEKIQVN